jgi:hypothetical protein
MYERWGEKKEGEEYLNFSTFGVKEFIVRYKKKQKTSTYE